MICVSFQIFSPCTQKQNFWWQIYNFNKNLNYFFISNRHQISYNSYFNNMGRQERKQIMAKVYREFSRQKYNKYKTQFPRLRESEVVTKIIKEWDALDNIAKDNLQKLYEDKKYLTQQDISSSEALMKADIASREARIAAEKAAKRHVESRTTPVSVTYLHSNARVASRDGSDFNRGSQQKDDSRLADSSSPALFIKTKPIAKPSQGDYISFFKQYYRSLSKEHPRWGPQQISKLIKLLWLKKKNTGKTLKKRNGRLRTTKPISGRRFFRKVKHLSGAEAKMKWKLLPLEAKNFWGHKAVGKQIDNSEIPGKVNLPSRQFQKFRQNLEFLKPKFS